MKFLWLFMPHLHWQRHLIHVWSVISQQRNSVLLLVVDSGQTSWWTYLSMRNCIIVANIRPDFFLADMILTLITIDLIVVKRLSLRGIFIGTDRTGRASGIVSVEFVLIKNQRWSFLFLIKSFILLMISFMVVSLMFSLLIIFFLIDSFLVISDQLFILILLLCVIFNYPFLLFWSRFVIKIIHFLIHLVLVEVSTQIIMLSQILVTFSI